MRTGSNEWTRAMVLVLVLFVLAIVCLLGLALVFEYVGWGFQSA